MELWFLIALVIVFFIGKLVGHRAEMHKVELYSHGRPYYIPEMGFPYQTFCSHHYKVEPISQDEAAKLFEEWATTQETESSDEIKYH